MASKDKACRKFQANIFNKSKCQNCFKAKEAHFLNSEDLRQVKVLYGGWLLLAPDGMNFDNPSHRARKWQRRFFVLFEHGLLRYALDEMPSTLPQGTIDMTLCSDVLDAESLTGQSNSLCILSPDAPHAQHFIRTHSRESMQGWRESLLHFVRSGKENLERKRKEPCLPKVSVTMNNGSKASRTRLRGAPCICPREHEERRDQSAIPYSHSAPSLQQQEHGLLSQSRFSSESLEDCTEQGSVVGGRKKQRVDSGYFSLERNQSGTCSPPPPRPCHLPLPLPCSSGPQGPHRYTSPDSDPPTSPYSTLGSLDSELSPGTPISVTTPPCCDDVGGAGRGQGCGRYASLADVPRAKRLSSRPTLSPPAQQQQRRARSPGREEVVRLFGRERRRPPVIAKFETLEGEPPVKAKVRRHLSKSQTSSLEASAEHSMPAVSKSSQSSVCRSEAAKLCPQRPSESCVTPDLLNFKKGWLTKLHEDGTWQKHWFVLTDQSLRFFRDSAAEEAADLDGEIDLSTCYDVTEFSVPRKYGLQVHTRDGAFMLCAMTARIRRNWIQAIEKIVRPTIAPNVTCPPLSLHAAHRKTASFKLSVLQPSPLPEEWAQGQAGVAEIRPSIESPEEDRTIQAGSSCDSGLCNPIQDRRSYDCGDLAHKEGTVPPGGVPEEGADSVDGSCSSLSFSSSPASSCSSMLESEEEVLGRSRKCGVGRERITRR
ncbi:hypothetical protein GJAV_G00215860 [Gymnothorax javanicus]|nr:hypothetical protein GJAV_G00215860 [Gymnothorax javanicus]